MITPFLIKKTPETFDAIVVGSGISGGWALKELAERGLKVLLIERGNPVVHRKDYITEGKAPWEFAHRGKVDYQLINDNYAVQRKSYAFNDATKHFFSNDRNLPYQTQKGTDFTWIRGSGLGGRSILWARQSYRWSALDFESNARDGHGCDWPIRYQDLAPWYAHVERHAGICGNKDGLDILPDSEFLPPFNMNAVEKHFKKKVEQSYKNRHVINGRAAHITKATEFFLDQERYQCMARNECYRGCSFGAYFSTLSSTLPAALKTNNVKIACHSVVDSVIYDDKANRVTGVNVIDNETLESRQYKANLIFLCASTLGTTQIMLNSRSSAFPNGIGNSSGVLGHYLMDHIYNARGRGVFEGFEDDYYRGRRPTGIVVPRYTNIDKKEEKYKRGFFIAGGAGRGDWRQGFKEDDFGLSLKNKLRQPGPWSLYFYGSGEMLPRYENHVKLDPVLKDKWGIPQLNIDCSFGRNDKKLMKAIEKSCGEMLEAAGAIAIDTQINDDPPGAAVHEMGTARMGKDPQTSVLNSNNQCHDIPNLFVSDGACMASVASQNPSLTFMAISARAANIAAGLYKNKSI